MSRKYCEDFRSSNVSTHPSFRDGEDGLQRAQKSNTLLGLKKEYSSYTITRLRVISSVGESATLTL